MDSFKRMEDNKCNYCPKRFVEAKRLYRHLFDTHGISKPEIERIKQNKRRLKVQTLSVTKEKPIYPCEICRKPYLSKLGLVSHKEKNHNIPKPTSDIEVTDKIICPINICSKRFQTYFDLARHCDDDHRDLIIQQEVFRIHRLKFSDFDKFSDWKSEQEQVTETKFYTRSTETKVTYGRKTWFMKCLHTQKTSKAVDFYHHHCPAFIRVVERYSGAYEAVACFGHLGHPHYTQNTATIQYVKRNPENPDYSPIQIYPTPPKREEVVAEKETYKPSVPSSSFKYSMDLSDNDNLVDVENENFLEENI